MGHVQKRGEGRWRARYRDPVGKERSKSFDTQRDAKAWLRETEQAIATGDWVSPDTETVKWWADKWYETTATRALNTQRAYRSALRRHVLPEFGHLRVDHVDRIAVRGWVAQMSASGLAAPTVRQSLLVLRAVMDAAIDGRGLRSNPTYGVKPPAYQPREMLFLDAVQVDELADAIAAPYRPLILAAAYTGARAGELIALDRDNVGLLRRRIRFTASMGTATGRMGPMKTYKARTVVIPSFLADVLGEHLAHGRKAVFPSPRAERLHWAWFKRTIFTPALEAAPSIPRGLRFHDLRHTAASLAIAAGAHPKTISTMLGHSSIAVTMDRYSHLFDSAADDLADGLDRLRKAAAASPRPEATAQLIDLTTKTASDLVL
jgi:integrase